ncbi:MAG TPA: VOC family protein [Dehalococcoidia bacterium]|nr:VOC family protein [Dehalococcoidia bacterium]
MDGLTLDHVVIAVHDLDAATADYSALFGRDPSWRGEHPAYGTRNTLFRIDNTYVELLALRGGKGDARWAGELARFLDAQGEGVYALALGTGDVDAAVREARVRGLDVLDPADGEGVDAGTGARRAWRNAQAPLKSTNGVRLFFIEHRSPEGALPAAAVTAGGGAFVKRMDHAVVLSADMEASRRLWGQVLDVRLALDRTFPERNTRILFFRLGDITVEISGGAMQTQEGMGKPDRLWGLAWGVDDLRAMCDRLNAAGIETSGPRPGIKPGTLVATAKGPRTHGVATLLIEHTQASFTPEARAPQGAAFDNAPQQRAFTAKGLDHLVISTSDLEAAAGTWAGTLGLAVSEMLEPDGAHLRLATLPAGNAFIELIQPLTEDHRIARTIAERGPGMFSIAIEVDDVEAAVRDLRAKGVVVSDADGGIFAGTRIARIDKFSANGVAIQLIQRG